MLRTEIGIQKTLHVLALVNIVVVFCVIQKNLLLHVTEILRGKALVLGGQKITIAIDCFSLLFEPYAFLDCPHVHFQELSQEREQYSPIGAEATLYDWRRLRSLLVSTLAHS